MIYLLPCSRTVPSEDLGEADGLGRDDDATHLAALADDGASVRGRTGRGDGAAGRGDQQVTEGGVGGVGHRVDATVAADGGELVDRVERDDLVAERVGRRGGPRRLRVGGGDAEALDRARRGLLDLAR